MIRVVYDLGLRVCEALFVRQIQQKNWKKLDLSCIFFRIKEYK